jgi:hypothetical protein
VQRSATSPAAQGGHKKKLDHNQKLNYKKEIILRNQARNKKKENTMSRITDAIKEIQNYGEMEEAEKLTQLAITIRLKRQDELLWFDKLAERLEMKRATLAKFLLMEAVFDACEGLGIKTEDVFFTPEVQAKMSKALKAKKKREAKNV